jgi:NAD(P)H dehydrogenase (quinone)
MTRIAIIYYSSTGSVYDLALAVECGARDGGCETRLRRAAELAPAAAIAANPAWQEHLDAVSDRVPEATLEDLEWADGYAFGTPTRFGNVAAQLKQFMDQAGPLWAEGVFVNRPATAFTSAMNPHGGQESTILALANTLYHWGCIIVPVGYTAPAVYEAGGNPYGTSWASGPDGQRPDHAALAAARYQGRRLAVLTQRLTRTAARAA